MQTAVQADITYEYATSPIPGVFSREEVINRLEAGIESPVKYSMADIERMSEQWVS